MLDPIGLTLLAAIYFFFFVNTYDALNIAGLVCSLVLNFAFTYFDAKTDNKTIIYSKDTNYSLIIDENNKQSTDSSSDDDGPVKINSENVKKELDALESQEKETKVIEKPINFEDEDKNTF